MDTATTTDTGIRPADLLTTRALLHRPARAPNWQAEAVAFRELSQSLVDDPGRALRRFPEIALRLCNAGTAGLSLLRPDEAGEATVHWEAISGALAAHEGADTPRDFSPCGLCLDAGMTILVSRPERVFPYLYAARPAIVEDLIVPLYDSDKRPLGTFWLAHHDSTSRFCSEDARIVEQLAIQLVLALKLLEHARERRQILALLESQEKARRAVADDLAEAHSRRERAEASESAVRQALVFKDTVIQEVNHRVKNTIQIAASLLSLHARATPSAQVRLALQESYARLHLLADVHELLYRSIDGAQEILMLKLLRAIGDALRQSFAEMSPRVRLEVSCDQIMLCPEDAIPLALLSNELMTNAYKHAFPDGSSGQIILTLRCAPGNAVILQITDNGAGMHSRSDENGLGLKLIRTFATQLQGTLAFTKPSDATGTTVTLTIQRRAQAGSAD